MKAREDLAKVLILHGGVVAGLFVLGFVLPEYHHGVLARVLVLSAFAMGYNILFGYAGLLSLGHAMFFAAGLYGAGLPMVHLGWSAPAGLASGIALGAALALVVGLLALRTVGVAFMIVTMMFSQVFYLSTLYFSEWTRGDDGLVIPQAQRGMGLFGVWYDLSQPMTRYMAALALFTVLLAASLAIARSRFGRVLVAIRENEERTRMLGYDTFANKLAAVVVSGAFCAAAGAAYALLFGYFGSTFAAVQYSIFPLLWVLLGGAATVLGPFLGTLLMYYAVDIISGYTSAYMLAVGLLLILLVLYFPKGVLGTLRERWLRWLP